MFTNKKNTYVDDLIAKAVIEIQKHEIGSTEYDDTLERITKLQKIRNEERNAILSDLPSADAIITVAANLLGIVLIISTEREHVLTTKALSMLQKTKH